jgi:hypothetical protein
MKTIYFIIFGLNILFYNKVQASIGDNSYYYQLCLKKCLKTVCKYKNSIKKLEHSDFEKNQSLILKILGWDCKEECKYECMWQTVSYMTEVEKRPVPQFHGKWPFIRFYGIQEPISALASLLNLFAHVYMINKMIYATSYRSPLKKLWYMFGLISINTWIWSAIFHTRDFDFTEKMDYFCAFSLVLFQFNCFFVRTLTLRKSIFSKLLLYLICFLSILYFLYHVYYLSFINFDYGFNMNVNIFFGAMNSICWIFWSIYYYFYLNKKYVWRCALSVFLVDILMSLEIFEFSPLFWLLDSHALWHLSTTCIPFFWYQFIIDDNYNIDLERKYI